MKIIYSTILAVAIFATSCGKGGAPEIIEEQEITKMVKAEVINGETTVTITTTENGETTTEILTGDEAASYMETDHLSEHMGDDIPDGANVIVKTLDHNTEIDIDVAEIMNDPEIQSLDAETKEKIQNALEGAMENMDVDVKVIHTEGDHESTVKTKVMVIDESK